jgi:uncharacterized protein YaaR (DUF327 family)
VRRRLALALSLVALASTAIAQDKNAAGIYSCVDSKGRRLTSDRPIVECLDREQKQLGNSGTVKRVVPPSYTAEERAQLESKRRAEELEQARINEEKRREKALLIRYPNQAMHDKERAEALTQIDEVMAAVRKRGEALVQDRKDIDIELEFYKNDIKLAPPWLKRKIEDNEAQVQIQKRFLNDQMMEKQRINARFDEELSKLRTLWKNR